MRFKRNQLVPFIEQAPIISVQNNMNFELNKILWDGIDFKSKRKNIVYRLKPSNMLVAGILNTSTEYVNATLVEIDYGYVASLIKVEDNVAYYPQENGFDNQPIYDDTFINLNANQVELFKIGIVDKKVSVVPLPMFNKVREELVQPMNEASLEALKKKKASIKISTNKPNTAQIRIESYLKSGFITNRVPLLLGMSGIAKSSLVKSVCDKLGFRMVDIRTAYMDRLDIQGLTEITYNSDGTLNSSQAPMAELISCTDEYIKYCREALPLIKKKMSELNSDDPQMENLKLMYKKYEECSKPPVLFFDEV